jgi:2-C-methyl-D-erythritol 2,4-cyclodiphosphate synthase
MASLKFLTEVANLLRQNGFQIENIDSNILAERPRLLPHFPGMREKMAGAAGIPIEKIFVKAKTMEGIGPIGAGEAIAAEAVALISQR